MKGEGNLVRGQLWGATVSTLAMKYGVENEPVARKTFATSFINKGISCVDTGMWVNGRYPVSGHHLTAYSLTHIPTVGAC